jgi:ABC-type nitrate/sulfonate/bicarbonate transport system permease component
MSDIAVTLPGATLRDRSHALRMAGVGLLLPLAVLTLWQAASAHSWLPPRRPTGPTIMTRAAARVRLQRGSVLPLLAPGAWEVGSHSGQIGPRILPSVGRGFSRGQFISRLFLPAAMPSIPVGVRLALIASWVASVGADYFMAPGPGIGGLSLPAASDFRWICYRPAWCCSDWSASC